ncbi:MAG TPA: hypothetical protein VK577_25215 [Bradyrhizobium sp.]|nr:hypothetical protein [Bradyrhizobium sp.]
MAELAGADHTPYVGDSDALLDGIEEFLTGIRPVPSRIETLATILFTDVVDSTKQAASENGVNCCTLVGHRHRVETLFP